ncbi:MAG TPA: YhjD/YihY/BrkB family envelope integrity protein [Spirochaetota bacterium]|nr:YhjD/YihY/BrkB family envelope integrity protein [Spirochaetota bacterium]
MTLFKKKINKKLDNPESLTSRIFALIKNIYEGYYFEKEIYNRLINTVKVFVISTRKFMVDDCLTKASAIAYAVITSLIPALTVFLTFFSIFSGVENKKEDLFRDISLFMTEHSIKLNIDPVFEAVSGLIDNAEKVGGVGAIIVIFTATATLRAVEKSLNDIWKVKQGRTLFQKIIYYWAALTLGPVMLIAGTTVATKMSNVFSSANYNAAVIEDKTVWVVGDKGSLLQSTINKKLKFTEREEGNFDYENQRIFSYKFSDNTFSENDFRIDHIALSSETFNDIQFINNNGWVVADKGFILMTGDKGKNWSISKWGDFNFNDIYMVNSQKGFIAANKGVILATENGGRDWRVIDTKDVTMNFSSITFYQNRGIATGTKGRIFITEDGGLTWNIRTINESKRKNRLVDLNSAFFLDRSRIWISANDGVILSSSNGGASWKQKKFREYNYYSVVFLNTNEGFIAGENGILIHTTNGGMNWKRDSLSTQKINRLLYSEGNVWAVGNGGTIKRTADMGKKWTGQSGVSIFAMFIKFLAPFIFIWLLFLMTYTTTPNTKVPFKYASIGAAFTGTVWVGFIFLFIIYIKAFATGTFAIYGALASIPLFLLMIYASSLIILYGAEVSYTLMHPETYANLKNTFEENRKVNIFYGLAALDYIYKKFEEGKGDSHYSELLKKLSHNSVDLDYFLKLFVEKGLLHREQAGPLMPTMSSNNIKLKELFSLINEAQIAIPSQYRRQVSKGNLADIFNKINSGRDKVLESMTLKDLKIF